MNSVSDEVNNLGQTILKLEKFIKDGRVTKEILEKVQKQVDHTDDKYTGHSSPDSAKLFTRLYELQAMIEYGRNNNEKAAEFIKDLHEIVPHPRFVSDTFQDFVENEFSEYAAKHTKTEEKPKFFIVSTARLVIFSIFTIGIYDRYWQYKNWKCLEEIKKEKQSPILNSIFAPLMIWTLLRQMKEVSNGDSKDIDYSPGIRTLFYWLLSIFTVGFLSSLAITGAQTQIRKYTKSATHSKFTGGEQTLIVLAVIVWGLYGIAAYNSGSYYGGFEVTRDNYVASCQSVATSENSGVTTDKAIAYCGCIYDKGVERFGVADFTRRDREYDSDNATPEMSQLINDCLPLAR